MLQRISGIPLALNAIPTAYFLMNSPWIDPSKPIFGIDPFLFIGTATIGTATIGYLVGNALPMLFMNWFRRGLFREYNDRQSNFYTRIIKHRVSVAADPSKLVQNADFYGEKIRSVSDYKAWLRLQAKLSKTANFRL